MRRDYLAETWMEKFANYAVGEEYLYCYETPEQLERARKAVDTANRKGQNILILRARRSTFSIKCERKSKQIYS